MYDVFWVFGSPKVIGDNVMLTVATSKLVDGPFKLLFPRAIGGVGEAANYPFSLLGLGDVAVPGRFFMIEVQWITICVIVNKSCNNQDEIYNERTDSEPEFIRRVVNVPGPEV